MSAFGKSFERAFISGADTGSKAAMDGIKEKILKEQEKAKKDSQLSSIKGEAMNQLELLEKIQGVAPEVKDFAKNQFSLLLESKDPDMAMKSFESTRKMIESNVGKDNEISKIKELIKLQSDAKSSGSPGAAKIYQAAEADLARMIGGESVEQSQPSQPTVQSPSEPTKTDDIEIDVFGKPTLQGEFQIAQKKADMEVGKQATADRVKRQQETEENVEKAKSLLKQTASSFSRMANKTKEITGLKPGRFAGVANTFFLEPTGQNPYIKAFKGDLVETCVALAKIAAPSARIGPDIMKEFAKTMPNVYSNTEETREQLALSMANSLNEYAARFPEKFPDGADVNKFRDMTIKMLEEVFTIDGDKKPSATYEDPDKEARYQEYLKKRAK